MTDSTEQLATLRRIVAEHIARSTTGPTGTADELARAAAVSLAAAELHVAIDAAGIDLSPELVALAARDAEAAGLTNGT